MGTPPKTNTIGKPTRLTEPSPADQMAKAGRRTIIASQTWWPMIVPQTCSWLSWSGMFDVCTDSGGGRVGSRGETCFSGGGCIGSRGEACVIGGALMWLFSEALEGVIGADSEWWARGGVWLPYIRNFRASGEADARSPCLT